MPHMEPGAQQEELNAEALQLVAARFAMLADPLRLRILMLLRHGQKNVSELTAQLSASQSNVSRHLRLLGDAGLVGRKQRGNRVYCFVTDPTVFELCDTICATLHARVTEQARLLEQSVPLSNGNSGGQFP